MVGIVHKAVKSSGEKGLSTEWNDDHEITGNIDQDKNQFLNAVIENRTDFPAGPVEGQIIYRTDLKATYVFNGVDWSLSNRRINYWNIPGVAFTSWDPATDDVAVNGDEGGIFPVSGTVSFIGSVELPHGAVITGAVVYGGYGATTVPWYLRRSDPANYGFASTMASANIGTEDTSITNATVDNSKYFYHFETLGLTAGETIFGARITYIL